MFWSIDFPHYKNGQSEEYVVIYTLSNAKHWSKVQTNLNSEIDQL